MDGDDFFTGGPPDGGDAPQGDGGGPEGGYTDLGASAEYVGGDFGNSGGDFNGAGEFNGTGFDTQQANGDSQTNGFDGGAGGFQQGYASLDEPLGGSNGNGMGANDLGNMGEMADGMDMPAPEDMEPSALDEFNERWQALLNKKASMEEEAKAAALEAAKADLETHAVERSTRQEAKMGKNRDQEQVFLEHLEGELECENPWERVVSLVDTQTEIVEEFQDKSRMTSILIQLKNDPLDVSA